VSLALAARTLASAALLLASCSGDEGAGYIEIKTVPASAAVVLYIDSVKLDPMRNGNALLRQRAGTAKLQANGDGTNLSVLCNVEVKKNRITTVTVSAITRQLRCQCTRTGASDSGVIRTCIG
jgi:hypothetical protein